MYANVSCVTIWLLPDNDKMPAKVQELVKDNVVRCLSIVQDTTYIVKVIWRAISKSDKIGKTKKITTQHCTMSQPIALKPSATHWALNIHVVQATSKAIVLPWLIDHSSVMESQDPYRTWYPPPMHEPLVSVSRLNPSQLLDPGLMLGVKN